MLQLLVVAQNPVDSLKMELAVSNLSQAWEVDRAKMEIAENLDRDPPLPWVVIRVDYGIVAEPSASVAAVEVLVVKPGSIALIPPTTEWSLMLRQ